MSPLPTEVPAIPNSVKIAGAAVAGGVLAGGMFKLEGSARLVLIAGVVAVGVLLIAYALFIKWYAARASAAGDEELMEGLRGKPQGLTPEQQAQVADFSRKFEEGVVKFKANGLKLSELPWYLLVGEPGSGKSEAVRHCGLDFPSGLNEEYQGAGGTVNMDWWFTDSGIILDTAGRFVADSTGSGAEWKKFLALLNKVRHDCPVNGLMLAIPATSLLKDNADEIHRKATNSAKFIDNLRRSLGIRFPVFVVITKSDLIPGFREFFSSITDSDLQHQMLGWSNPASLDEPFDPNEVDNYLSEVRGKLLRRRLSLLVDPIHTDDPAARRLDQVDAMYLFPDALTGIASGLRRYLQGIFVKNKFNQAPLFLRGIYFTSAMEEGAALDAKLAEIRGVPLEQIEAEGSGWKRERAVFLRDVFTKKVFEEWGLVTRDLNVDRGQRRRKISVLAGGFACVAILMALTFWNASRFEKSIGAPRAFWQAIGENQAALAILSPGNKYNNEKLPDSLTGDGAAQTPTQFFNNLQIQTAQPITVPWLYGFSASELNDKRAQASRALFDSSVLLPLVNASRAQLRSGKSGPASRPWDVQGPSASALHELIHLEQIVAPKEASSVAKEASSDEHIHLDPIFRLILPNNPAYNADAAKSIQDAFDAFHPHNQFLAGIISPDPADIEKGVDQFVKYWQDQLGKQGSEFAGVFAISGDLAKCAGADDQLRKLSGRLNDLHASDYGPTLTELQQYVGAFEEGTQAVANDFKKMQFALSGGSLHDYVVSRHIALSNVATAARKQLKTDLVAAGNSLDPALKKLNTGLEELLDPDAIKKTQDGIATDLGKVDWLLTPMDGNRRVYEVLLLSYQAIAKSAASAGDGSINPASWREVLVLFQNGNDLIKDAKDKLFTAAQIGGNEQLQKSHDAADLLLQKFAVASVRYYAIKSRLTIDSDSADKFAEAVRTESKVDKIPDWTAPRDIPLSELTRGVTFAPEYNPDAANAVVDAVSQIQLLDSKSFACLDQDKVRTALGRWSSSLKAYSISYAKYWEVDVRIFARPLAVHNWKEFVDFAAGETSHMSNNALVDLANRRLDALKLIPVPEAAKTDVEGELIDLKKPSMNDDRDTMLSAWGHLGSQTQIARSKVQDMQASTFGKIYCPDAETIDYWRQLPLIAVKLLADSTATDAENALKTFKSKYAGKFPLAFNNVEDRLSFADATDAHTLLAALVSSAPVVSANPDPNNTIRDGGRPPNHDIAKNLDGLFSPSSNHELTTQYQLLTILLSPDTRCSIYLTDGPDMPPYNDASLNHTVVYSTYKTQTPNKIALGKGNKSDKDNSIADPKYLLIDNLSFTDDDNVNLTFQPSDKTEKDLVWRVKSPWPFLELIFSPDAKRDVTAKQFTWTVPYKFKESDGKDCVVWLRLNFDDAAGKKLLNIVK